MKRYGTDLGILALAAREDSPAADVLPHERESVAGDRRNLTARERAERKAKHKAAKAARKRGRR